MYSTESHNPFSRREFIQRAGITGAGLLLLSMFGLRTIDEAIRDQMEGYYPKTRAYIEQISPSQIAKLKNNPMALYKKEITDCYDDLPWDMDYQMREQLPHIARFSPYLFSRNSQILASGSILKVAGSYLLASTVPVLDNCMRQGVFFAGVSNHNVYGIIANGYEQSRRNPLLAYIPIQNPKLIAEIEASPIQPLIPDLAPVDNQDLTTIHPLKDSWSQLHRNTDNGTYSLIGGRGTDGEGIYTNMTSISIGAPTFNLDSHTPITGMIYEVPEDPTQRVEAETGARSSTQNIAIMPICVQDFTDSTHIQITKA